MKLSAHRLATVCLSLACAAGLMAQASASSAASAPAAGRTSPAISAPPDALSDPGADLGSGWRQSGDRAVAVAGDSTGLHVLTATASTGYAWKTVATLTVRGEDTTRWIGQACITGSGQQAVVVYAPWGVTNDPQALGYGALAAIVDLGTGKVTPIGVGVSIAYFDPGCGTGQTAVLTQGGTGADPMPGPGVTRLMLVNTSTGKITSDVTVAGQVTSAVPYGNQIAAVYGPGLVSVDSRGQVHILAKVAGRPFRLTPDAAGGLGFQVATGRQVQVRRFAAGHDQLVGTAQLGAVELQPAGGRVVVTGLQASRLGRMPASWLAMNVLAGAAISTTGRLAVTAVSTPLDVDAHAALAAPPDQSQPVSITATVAATRKQVSFTVPPAPPARATALPRSLPGFPGGGLKPASPAGRVQATAAPAAGQASNQRMSPAVSPPPYANPATTTYDPDRTCSVPRNDPSVQTYQPSAEEVQWAVDQAVQKDLTDTRGPNLYGSGLPAYTPQGMFPAPGLDGGGSVPAQILLGILTQESNLDQASDHAIIGQTGNFEPSFDWYGDYASATREPGTYVEWGAADCGYGIGQVTTGMCLAGVTGCTNPFPYNDQLAVAVDFQANIAAALQLLEDKWNQLYSLGIKANSSDPGYSPKYIENWWFALWDYNSGLEPDSKNGNTTGCSPGPACTDSGGDWGLGWVNNPANMTYPPDRPQFLEGSSSPSQVSPTGSVYSAAYDSANPQYWSYEEKVIGWAYNGYSAWSYIAGKEVQAYPYGSWPSPTLPPYQPSYTALCSQAASTNDHCNPGDINLTSSQTTTDPCQLTGALADHCWWHWPLNWTECSVHCGQQVLTYAAGAADPGDPGVPAGYAPDCSSSPLPSNAVIVGDVASSIPAPLGCGTSWSNNGGTMTWNFAAGADPSTGATVYPSKIDFHQIGGGYSGHFWFTHTIPSSSILASGSQPPQAGVAELAVTGTWTPPSSVSGWTRIMAAIPNTGAWDPEASYQIKPGGGAATDYRVINQAQQSDTWVDLGLYKLGSGAAVSLSNVTYEGLGYDIAWGAMAFIPASAPTADYVALGDSYSSGQGLSPYQPDSNFSEGQTLTTPAMSSACNRSQTQAYPDLVTEPGATKPIAQQATSLTSGTDFAFLACSGQWTTQITERAADKQSAPAYGLVNQAPMQNVPAWDTLSTGYGELPQADQGALNASTTLVTMTTGGDDIRFAKVGFDCVLDQALIVIGSADCTDGATVSGDPKPIYQYEPEVISNLLPHLEQVYSTVAADAPHAEIIVIAYPDIFAGDTGALGCAVSFDGSPVLVGPGLASWFNGLGDLLRGVIEQAVSWARSQGININLVNADPAFTGHHICDSTSWIGGIYPLPDVFHPNAAGQQEFATLIDQCLAGDIPSADLVKGDGTC